MNCQFVAPGLKGAWIEGRGQVTRRTRDLVFVECKITSGPTPVMTATGIFKLL